MAPIKPLSREEFKDLINEVLDERQELVGLPTNTQEARAALRADAAFVRRLRLGIDAAAKKVGYLVLTAGVGLFLAIFAAGFKIKIGG